MLGRSTMEHFMWGGGGGGGMAAIMPEQFEKIYMPLPSTTFYLFACWQIHKNKYIFLAAYCTVTTVLWFRMFLDLLDPDPSIIKQK